MARKSFNNWVRHVYQPKGHQTADFKDDWTADKRKPVVHSLPQLVTYLRSRNACSGAVAGARQAWKAYENYMASHG